MGLVLKLFTVAGVLYLIRQEMAGHKEAEKCVNRALCSPYSFPLPG